MSVVIHSTGSRVWVKDQVESWVKAEVVKVENDHLLVRLEETGEERKCNPDDCPLQNQDTRGVEVRACCTARSLLPAAFRLH
jgi:hypothetical protein